MFLPCLDEFLGLDGSCVVYNSVNRAREAMTKQCRAVLEALQVTPFVLHSSPKEVHMKSTLIF